MNVESLEYQALIKPIGTQLGTINPHHWLEHFLTNAMTSKIFTWVTVVFHSRNCSQEIENISMMLILG